MKGWKSKQCQEPFRTEVSVLMNSHPITNKTLRNRSLVYRCKSTVLHHSFLTYCCIFFHKKRCSSCSNSVVWDNKSRVKSILHVLPAGFSLGLTVSASSFLCSSNHLCFCCCRHSAREPHIVFHHTESQSGRPETLLQVAVEKTETWSDAKVNSIKEGFLLPTETNTYGNTLVWWRGRYYTDPVFTRTQHRPSFSGIQEGLQWK